MEVKYRISVHVDGVKKRCRKPDRHILSLGYIPFGEFDVDELSDRAKDLVSENIKTVTSGIKVVLNKVSISDGIETWKLFDKENAMFTVKSGLENSLQ